MKISIRIIFFMVALAWTGCGTGNEGLGEFNFYIEGVVTGGEGERLELHLPGRINQDPLVATVKNGRFEFTGTLQHPEKGSIVFEKEFRDYDGSYSNYYVFVDRDTIRLKADLITNTDNPYFANDTILSGRLNAYYHTNIRKYFSDRFSMKFGDEAYMDSMKRFVFPGIRSRLLDNYQKYFSAKENSLIGLYLLQRHLSDKTLFAFADLTPAEKSRVTKYFQQIDPSLNKGLDYTLTAMLVEKMNSGPQKPAFRDFSLLNIDGSTTRLSEIIKANKVTVLDFWWFGCGPCREFNVSTRKDYAMLKSKGLEIVGISADYTSKRWKEATALDSIPWVNLFAGQSSAVEMAYDVDHFPFKVAVDNQFRIIDKPARTTDDLLQLLK